MKRHLILLTVLAIFVFGMNTVFAQHGDMLMRKFADDDFPEFTAEQRDQMAKLRTEFQKAMIPVRADLRLKQVELRELIRTEASQSMINSKLDEIGALKTQLSKMKIDHRLKAKSVMTDKQREYFEEHRGMMKMYSNGDWGSKGKGDCMHRRDKGNCGPRGGGHFDRGGGCFFNHDINDDENEEDDDS